MICPVQCNCGFRRLKPFYQKPPLLWKACDRIMAGVISLGGGVFLSRVLGVNWVSADFVPLSNYGGGCERTC